MKRTSLIIGLMACIAFPQNIFADIKFQDLSLPKAVPLKTDYYEIYPRVTEASMPGFLKFKVTSAHHLYEVEGISELYKILHEIEVVERVRRHEDGTGAVDGAVDSVVGTGKGLFKLVAHPVASVAGVGKAAEKLGSKIGSAFREKDEGEKTGFSDTIYGKSERDIAKKFSVDVYSSNPYLREIISKMAKSRSIGEGAVMIASFFIPVGLIGNVVLTTSGTNKFADQIVNDTDRFDLFQDNQDALVKLGFGLYDAKRFLNHQFYSPREQTYMRFYLKKLKNVQGFREILKHATNAKSAPEAHKILREAEMAADHMDSQNPYQEIKYCEEGFLVLKANQAVLISGYDYVDKGALAERLMNRVRNAQKTVAEIWLAGKMSSGCLNQLRSNGIGVREWILFESIS